MQQFDDAVAVLDVDRVDVDVQQAVMRDPDAAPTAPPPRDIPSGTATGGRRRGTSDVDGENPATGAAAIQRKERFTV